MSNGLRVRETTEVETGPATLLEKMAFTGGTLLVCTAGELHFDFNDGTTVRLAEGHAIVIYPGSVVTLRAMREKNRFLYVVVDEGASAIAYLNAFSFYDRLTFPAAEQSATFSTLRQTLHAPASVGVDSRAVAVSLLSDMLRTFQYNLRQCGNALFFDAINLINCNLARGIVRTEPLCEALLTSRSHLHKQFIEHCGIGPGEFIRRQQLKLARWYLANSHKTIKEIGALVGIPSSVYFTIFIRRMTGMTPSDLRLRPQ